MEVINYIGENYGVILAAVGAVVSAATMITALTPTKKDDEIVSKIRKVLEFVSLRLNK